MEFKLKRIKPKTKILKAVNVYSLMNHKQGLGDYIRGCICMLQIMQKKNIPFDMDISRHAIQRWFRPTVRYPIINLEQISHPETNRPDRLKYIESKLEKANGIYTFFSNDFPIAPITMEEKIFIRNQTG